MAVGTPFHERTAALCRSYDWRQWSGYLTVSSYDDYVQPEYAAIRNSAALIDISPLYKYRVAGREAEAVVNHVVTQDMSRLVPGQISYTPWCDADGAVRQEGTVFRLADDEFVVCAAEPAFDWFRSNGAGFDATVEDRSTEIAALSLQGPHSRAILDDLTDGAVSDLPFFQQTQVQVEGVPVAVSRTGFTGDLGYELWIPADQAIVVWDALLAAGDKWQITPCGLVAMDVSRVEAGFILIGVDYISSEAAHLPDERYDPYEIGLGWAVKLDKGNFIGRKALEAIKARGPARRVVGLELEWQPLEELFLASDLMPELPMNVCRESVPVYSTEGKQVGRVTSRVWSKLLKKYLAIATIDAAHAEVGSTVEMEVTVHHHRRRAPAKVAKLPFFSPERMRG
ncbi:MAG: aminomethyl transferase family protein [Acidobacteria bacterium]|nr:aminomethyl transferase family protein [Acidobacteriota bacterium]